MTKPMLTVVLETLAARKGQWREISRQIDPVSPDSYYSWLTKLAQGTIREPSVNKIQRLYDFFRSEDTRQDINRDYSRGTNKAAA